jgi:cation diffusion facilitator CzcD-associated flavoprotein CzcO
MSRTIVIIGAGPIGLAAAAGALARGHVPIVFEKDEPGAALARYGATRLFSPMSMNLPPALATLCPPGEAPSPDALLTGPEFARMLGAIARSPALAKHVHCKHRVVSVTRHNLSRGDNAGHPVRAELPFRVVVCANGGTEKTIEADAVLDATGVYDVPVPIIAPGASLVASRAIRDLGALHARLPELAGARVLLVGHGHSAANAIVALESLCESAPGTRVTWALRSRNLRPLSIVPSDPLPERERIVDRANALASKPPSWLAVERAAFVESFEKADGGERTTLALLSGARRVSFDHAIWLTGNRPDLSFTSELPLEISPATEGAMRLARALANVTDCLSIPKVKPEDLASGEPRFHFIGSKSYGRARTFLLQTGYAQVETILDSLFDG